MQIHRLHRPVREPLGRRVRRWLLEDPAGPTRAQRAVIAELLRIAPRT